MLIFDNPRDQNITLLQIFWAASDVTQLAGSNGKRPEI
jgi:hypothetical protein